MLLAPDKEHKKGFPHIPVVVFANCKSLKDYLFRAALPKINETWRYELCRETFNIQSGPLNCDLEKVLYLLKCKGSSKAPYVGKAKMKF